MKPLQLTSLALVLAAAAEAQQTSIFPFEPGPSSNTTVFWTADSNFGPLGAFIQMYPMGGDLVVRFTPSPTGGAARILDSRFLIPNWVVGGLQSGQGSASVGWRDVEIGVSSAPFNLVPALPGPTFTTTLELEYLSGWVEIDPPFGPAVSQPLAGMPLASVAISGSFPSIGPTQNVSIDPFSFEMPFSWGGFNGSFVHDAEFTAVSGCPTPEAYCLSNPASPGGGANLGLVGSTSLSANDFNLLVTDAPPNTFGVVAAGRHRGEVPAGFGTLCIGGNLRRLQVAQTGPMGNALIALDLTQWPAPLAVGSHRNLQFWHRVVTPVTTGFNFSNALAVVFCH